jgi:hypothetical protein
MILYTIQTEDRFNKLQEKGYLVSDKNIIFELYFLDSYSWLENRMREKLPSPEIECLHPIWAWYKYNKKTKPTLKGQLSKGEIGYLIKFEIDDNLVLLSSFDKWHLVLNGREEEFKLKKTIFDLEGFNQEDISILESDGFVVEDNKVTFDWNNIFLDRNSNEDTIQATFWCLKKEQIISYKKFKSR